uniref:Putative group i salivary lipocalin n=1 Tax=Rhipicephalus pulchellus TaxID=72859 RepID=L7LQW7_RHIPC
MNLQDSSVGALVALFPAFLFCLLSSSDTPAVGNEIPSKPYNIVTFYTTRDPIITTNTTRAPDMCKDDIVVNTTATETYFLRGFRGTWMPPTLLWGLFWTAKNVSSNSVYNAMNVRSTGDKRFPPRNGTDWNSIEILLFASDDYTCGLFFVDMVTTGTFYDVRVRTPGSVGEKGKPCLEEGEKLVPKNFTQCEISNQNNGK